MGASLRIALLVVGLVLVGATSLDAMIVRKYPMKEVLKQSQYVFEARVKAVDARKKRFVVELVRELKGTSPFSRLNLNLQVSSKKEHPELLLKRVRDGLPVVIFGTRVRGDFFFLGYTNGTWFSMGSKSPPSKEPGRRAAAVSGSAERYHSRQSRADDSKDAMMLRNDGSLSSSVMWWR